MRKKIFIGQYKKQAIYFDVKEKQVYEAPKSSKLSAYRYSSLGKRISFWGALALIGGSRVFAKSNIHLLGFSKVGWWSWGIIIVGWLGFIYYFMRSSEDRFYKNVRKSVISTEDKFNQAIKNSPSYKLLRPSGNVTLSILTQLYLTLFVIFIMSLWAIGISIYGLYMEAGNYIDNSLYVVYILLAFLPAVFLSMVFQNNGIRWMKVVRDYQEGKIKFEEDKSET